MEKKSENEQPKKGGKLSVALSAVISVAVSALTAVIVLLLVIIVSGNIVRSRYLIVEVDGSSMFSTLRDGDVLYCDKNDAGERGDIVIIDVSGQPEFERRGVGIIIKRLIAVGGDSIKCENGVVYLAEAGGEYEPLEEPYIEGRNTIPFEVTLREGEIFVMGDNREDSTDCRSDGVGPLQAEDILGTVPAWSVEHKTVITGWENINETLFGWIRRGSLLTDRNN